MDYWFGLLRIESKLFVGSCSKSAAGSVLPGSHQADIRIRSRIACYSLITEYYTEGSLDEKSVTRIGSCQGGECLDALVKNFIPASA